MHHEVFKDKKGFTLVEALVAGVISVFVIAVVFAVYRMNMKEISGSFAGSLSKMQYQTMIDQIGGDIRRASSIASRLPDTGIVISPSDSILLYDSIGSLFAGYKRTATALLEWRGTQFVNFKVGSKNIKVLDVGTNNTFTIAPNRNIAWLKLTVIDTEGTSKDTVFSNNESFRCRNY